MKFKYGFHWIGRFALPFSKDAGYFQLTEVCELAFSKVISDVAPCFDRNQELAKTYGKPEPKEETNQIDAK